jgi:glycosyltransferase involved in cell wall biosynthesis
MKVAIEASCLLRGRAGVAVCTRELLAALRTLPESPDIQTITPSLHIRRFGKLAAKMDTLWNDFVWLEYTVPRRVKELQADVFHTPSPFFPNEIPRPWLLTLHDFYIKHHPECFSPWAVRGFLQREKQIPDANQILCVSNFTRNELLNSHSKIDPGKVSVVLHGVNPLFRPASKDVIEETLNRYSLRRPYFLMVGTVEPRKNILPIIRNFESGLAGKPHSLVIVGGDGWIPRYVTAVNEAAARSKRIRRLGHVGDSDLAALYSGAEAFLYPTLYEGFGLPVLEAMRCACPVICSRGSSLDEVCQGHALQLDPKDENLWIDALKERSSNATHASSGVEAAKRWAESFTWKKTAENTYTLYKRMLHHEP